MEYYYIFFAGILGLLVGSFLNVVAHRSPTRMFWTWKNQALEFLHEHHPHFLSKEGAEDLAKESILEPAPPGVVKTPSHCPHCKTPLKFYHNLPLVSFLFLRGKCGFCKTAISWQYPIVELLMGLIAAGCVAVYGFNATALSFAVFCAVLLVLSVIDLKTQYLPDDIVLPGVWAALLWSVIALHVGAQAVTPLQSIVGAAVGYLSLWSVYWGFKLITGKEGMGYGDFKLFALIGAFLGVKSLLPVILIAAVSGSIVGVILLKKKGKSMTFAFGPYLAIGGIICAIFPSLFDFLFI